jgi:hypothetical protein
MEHGQIAERLRLALEREAARHEVSPGAWSQIERRLRRQTWRRAGIVAVCVAVAAAGAAAAPYLRHTISGPVASPGVYRTDPRANRVTSFIRLQPTP